MEANLPTTSFPEAALDPDLLETTPSPAAGAAPPPGPPPAPTSPLAGEVALCLSGGGYRAAAFHLGVMDMLHRLDLLGRVDALSTISGGTIAGATYALSCARGESFDAFYDHLYDALRTRNIVADAFAGLVHSGADGAAPSLIRAAADVYAGDAFVGDARFAELLDTQAGPQDLIFSATEFRTGLAFRFQTSRRGEAVIGNQPPLRIREDVARSIRLADIVAASSCFPSAFEPLRFPDDFVWGEGLGAVRSALGEGFGEPLPLMDGGVYDNQGVDGILQVYRRRGRSVGLVIVSDSTPQTSPLFTFPATPRRGGLSVEQVVRLGYVLFGASLLSAVLLAADLFRALGGGLDAAGFFTQGIPFLLTVAVAAALAWVRSKFLREASRVYAQTAVNLWPVLRRLSVSDVVDLATGRVRSLIALTSSIFMKRVRGLVQRGLFLDREYTDRVVFSLIYDLTRKRTSLFDQAPWLVPTPALVQVAESAEAFPTTLWFTNDDDLQNLIAAGQATVCFKLVTYLQEKRPEALRQPGSDEARLLALARPLWEQLKLDPQALLRRA